MQKIIFPLLILAMLFGCEEQAMQKETERQESTPFNVKTEVVTSFSGSNKLEYSGLVEAKEMTPLSFKTAGNVVRILVEEGQSVKKGQLLATLNIAAAENAYQLVYQKQQQAQDAYDRMKPMKENGTLPEIKWVEIETGLMQTQIASQMAKDRIDNHRLYAPKSGVIGKKNILPGMNVMAGISVLELLDINTVYVNIPVPENEVNLLSKGQEADIYIGAISKNIEGEISKIGVSANILSHSYPVKIVVDNRGWAIKPGMVCAVSVSGKQTLEGFLISSKALQRSVQGDQYVYLLKGDEAQRKKVQTIDLVDQKVLVGGLSTGDEIIVSGQNKLRDGSVVNVLN